MNIDQLGSIGEFIGGIAVVVSLIYVAIQLRRNTKETRSAALEANAYKFVDLNIAIATNPEIMEAMNLVASRKRIEDLDTRQALIVHHVFQSVFNLTFQYYSRYKKGLGDVEQWTLLEHMMNKRFVPSPLFRSWFRSDYSLVGTRETNTYTEVLEAQITNYESSTESPKDEKT